MRTVHNHYDQLFPEYLRNTLTSGSVRDLEEHLRSCPDCRARLDDLKQLFAMLEKQSPEPPPTNYFATLLPRVREKIERKKESFIDERWVSRFVVPLAALALAIAIFARLPLAGSGEEPLQLKEFVRSLKSEDLVDVLVEESGRESLSQVSATEAAAAALPEDLVSREFARQILDGENIGDAVFPHSLADIDKKELDLILQKLGERTLL